MDEEFSVSWKVSTVVELEREDKIIAKVNIFDHPDSDNETSVPGNDLAVSTYSMFTLCLSQCAPLRPKAKVKPNTILSSHGTEHMLSFHT